MFLFYSTRCAYCLSAKRLRVYGEGLCDLKNYKKELRVLTVVFTCINMIYKYNKYKFKVIVAQILIFYLNLLVCNHCEKHKINLRLTTYYDLVVNCRTCLKKI